jgi:hypothetical protein
LDVWHNYCFSDFKKLLLIIMERGFSSSVAQQIPVILFRISFHPRSGQGMLTISSLVGGNNEGERAQIYFPQNLADLPVDLFRVSSFSLSE